MKKALVYLSAFVFAASTAQMFADEAEETKKDIVLSVEEPTEEIPVKTASCRGCRE